MEKSNDFIFKKISKANRYNCTHKDALFSVDLGTYKFTAYLEKIVKYAKLDYLRHQNLISRNEESTDDLVKFVDQRSPASLDDDFLTESIKATTLEYIASDEQLYKAISKLSPAEKDVLYHLYVEEMTPKEVASLMGISRSWTLRMKKNALYKLYCALESRKES